MCPPFYGERGQEFLLFERDFIAGISDFGDEYALLTETLFGTDGPEPVNPAMERRAWNKRRRDLYGKLYKHVENERIREQFATLGNDGRAAWLLLERECRIELTDVEILEMEGEWARASILSHVGYHEASITDFLRHLNALNARFPSSKRKNADMVSVKLLSSIDSPPELAVMATEELMRTSATQRFRRVSSAANVTPVTYERDPDAIATYFDGLWRNCMKRGVVKRKAASTSSQGNNRVDEGVLQANDSYLSPAADADASDSVDEAGFALRGSKGRNTRDSETVCYNCYGLGHVAAHCPSDNSVKRTPDEAIRRLSLLGKQQKPPNPRPVAQKPPGKGTVFRGNNQRKAAPQRKLIINGKAYVLDETAEEEVNQAGASSSPIGHGESVDESNLIDEYDGDEGSDDFAFCVISESSTVPPPATIFDSDLSDDEIFAVSGPSGESSAPPAAVPCCGLLELVKSFATDFCSWFKTGTDEIVYSGTAETNGPSEWIVDCGATAHCVPDASCLTLVTNAKPINRYVRVANGQRLPVVSVGEAHISVLTKEGSEATMKLSQVLVVEGLKAQLFSCKSAWRRDGIATELNDKEYLALPCGGIVPFTTRGKDSHYKIASLARDPQVETADFTSYHSTPKVDDDVIHARLGHFGLGRIKLASQVAKGLPLGSYRHDPTDCTACQEAGARRKPHPASGAKTRKTRPTDFKAFGQCISSDLCGPFDPSAFSGFTYAIVFVDLATRWVSVYFLPSKHSSEVLSAFRQFLADHKDELKANKGVSVWHTDNGGEFTSGDVQEFCKELSTRHTYSTPEEPTQNATSERAWGTLLRCTRVLLAHAGLPVQFWPFAMTTAVYVHNRLPTRGLDPPMAPFHKLYESVPDLSALRVFGCKCFVHKTAREQRVYGTHKLDPTAYEAVHLGVNAYSKAWFVYIPALGRVYSRYHVSFREKEFLKVEHLPSAERAASAPQATQRVSVTPLVVPDGVILPPDPPLLAAPADAGPAALSARVTKAPKRRVVHFGSAASAFLAVFFTSAMAGGDEYAYDVGEVGPIPEPKSVKQALDPSNPHAARWKEAMIHELQGKMGENRAWDLVDEVELRGRKAMKGKWIFKVKYKRDGSVEEFKARWVGCGYSQIPGIDFDATYASTLRGASFRLLVAVAALNRWHLSLVDVIKAFTQAPIDGDIYVEQPHGFVEPGKVCKLRMALEGLKQSGHLWMKVSTSFLESYGFQRSTQDPCLFALKRGGATLLLGVYVDDVVAVYSHPHIFDTFFKAFSTRFRVKAPRPLDKFMGIEVDYDRSTGVLSLCQSHYIAEMFRKFLSGTNTILWSTPVGTSEKDIEAWHNLSEATDAVDASRIGSKQYMSVMGSILYAACMTRPDIAYHASYLCQFMQNPSSACYDAALGLISYLHKTRHLKLTFGGDVTLTESQIQMGFDPDNFRKNAGLHCYFDSSFNRVPRPYCGYLVFFNGGVVSWSSKRLKLVPQSSCEAEIATGAGACKDLQFCRQALEDLGFPLRGPTPVVTDNSAAMFTVQNPGVTARTRHYERWIYYIRELYMRRVITIHLESTTRMVADIMTKALNVKVAYYDFRRMCGLRSA